MHACIHEHTISNDLLISFTTLTERCVVVTYLKKYFSHSKGKKIRNHPTVLLIDISPTVRLLKQEKGKTISCIPAGCCFALFSF